MTPSDPAGSETPGLAPGQYVGGGRYELKRVLGRGGMGVVWLAEDLRLHEQAALKFLPPEIQFDPVALDDMRRETHKSRKLSHPNIIRIHDLFEAPDEAPFISMEYVSGSHLTALRVEQPDRFFAWEYLRPLVKQLCDALEYAHSEGVVHRDLKPGNMMLNAKGRLKLADFGIAAVISDSLSGDSHRHATSGTLTYMSPQQMNGELPQPVDDLYALGATLYELLTSKPPFFSGDIVHQVQNVAPRPVADRLWELSLENPIPSDVAALIMACLSKDPAQRPQSARQVADWIGLELATRSSVLPARGPERPPAATDLEPLAPAEPAARETAMPRVNRRDALIAGVATLLLAGAGVGAGPGWQWLRRRVRGLASVWEGRSRFETASSVALEGGTWLSPLFAQDGGRLRAYYLNLQPTGDSEQKIAATLHSANESEERSWEPGEIAFTHGVVQWVYPSVLAAHGTGQREGDAWMARQGNLGHMVYGPYRRLPSGSYRAAFRLMVDRTEPAEEKLGYVDVSHRSGISMVVIDLKRGMFKEPQAYQVFELPFRCRSDQALEFRTYFQGGWLKQDRVTVTPQAGPHRELERLTQGSVFRDADQWYYVYQGLGELQNSICVATSADGTAFEPLSTNPVLRPSEDGWDKNHVGSPSLYREGGIWHLFYTGYDGQQTAVGVASGSSLTDLQKHASTILKSSGDASHWDGAGLGRFSEVIKEAGVYYAAYEGWMERDGQPVWQVGLARSQDLLAWTPAPGNPLTGESDFPDGADSPSLVVTNRRPVLYVRRRDSIQSHICRLELRKS